MRATSAIFLGIYVNFIRRNSERQEMDARHPIFKISGLRLAELHSSTVLHLMDCRMYIRPYRRNISWDENCISKR